LVPSLLVFFLFCAFSFPRYSRNEILFKISVVFSLSSTMFEALEVKMMTRHLKLRHGDLCKFIHVRSERLQMLICIYSVKQNKKNARGRKERKKSLLFFRCRHSMARIVVTFSFPDLSIASGRRKLCEVGEWWKKKRTERKRKEYWRRQKKETLVVTSQNHDCFLNHSVCVSIPFERILFAHSFCLILS